MIINISDSNNSINFRGPIEFYFFGFCGILLWNASLQSYQTWNALLWNN